MVFRTPRLRTKRRREEEEEDDDDDEEEDARRTASGAVATVAQVDGWFDAALSRGDVDAAKSIVRAFRAACYHGACCHADDACAQRCPAALENASAGCDEKPFLHASPSEQQVLR